MDRPGTAAAHPRVEPVHRRRLPRPQGHQGRCRSGRDRPVRPRVPRTVHRAEAAAGRLVPRHRHRLGSRLRRTDLRAGRQPAGSLRRLLPAAEPRGAKADVSEGLPRVGGAPGGGLPRSVARHARGRGATGRRAAAGGGRDAGPFQLGLFRTLVPCPANGRRIGGGARLGRRKRHGLHADHRRLGARPCHLSPHRRRLP